MTSNSIVSISVVIELIILGAVGYAATAFIRHKRLAYESVRTGFRSILFGLGLIGLFFAARIATHLLALAGSTEAAVPFEFKLPLDVAWFVLLFGIGAICLGVTRFLAAISDLHDGLYARETTLKQELAERKHIHDSLVEQDNLLNSIIDNLPVALLIKDPERKAERANPTFLQWYGFDENSLRTIDLRAKTAFHRENDHLVMMEHDEVVLRTGENRTRQVERMFKDGEVHTIRITKFPVYNSAGKIAKIGSIAIDLTDLISAESALAESEQRYRNAFEFAPYPMYIHNGHKLLAANLETAKTYGFESPEAMIGYLVIDLIHPDDRAKFEARLTKIRDGIALPFVVDRRVRRDGSTIYVEQSGTPIPWRGGTAILGFNRDISRERENEARLRQAQKMEAIGQLTAGIAHDFNNMLSVIIGNCEILEDRLGPEDQQTAAIAKSAENGARLTQRLLAFSRKQVLQPVSVDAQALVRGMNGLLSRTLSSSFTLDIQADADLWRCNVDVAQLESALVNLVNNARDAMPDGGELTISLSNAELDADFAGETAGVVQGQYVMIAVTDRGVGIAPEDLPHVFEPFFTTKDMGVGSGLGLSMIYGFVKQSGGRISIDSKLGHGTTVQLYLPRAEATVVDEAPQKTPNAPIGDGEKILIVEDDNDIRNLVATMLSSLGYAIAQASCSDEALKLLEGPGVDLVLTDIVLSTGLNGRELAQEIQRRSGPTRILYMSGYSENSGPNDALPALESQLLRKPFRKDALARAVRQALDGTA